MLTKCSFNPRQRKVNVLQTFQTTFNCLKNVSFFRLVSWNVVIFNSFISITIWGIMSLSPTFLRSPEEIILDFDTSEHTCLFARWFTNNKKTIFVLNMFLQNTGQKAGASGEAGKGEGICRNPRRCQPHLQLRWGAHLCWHWIIGLIGG